MLRSRSDYRLFIITISTGPVVRNRSPGYFFTIVNRYMALLEKRLHSITITTVQYQLVPHVHPNPHKTLPAGFCTNKTASDVAAISIAHEKKKPP